MTKTKRRIIQKHLFVVLFICLFFNPVFFLSGQAEEGGKGEKSGGKELLEVISLEKNAAGHPIALKTAILHFAGTTSTGEPLAVDLIGAIHFADAPYYESLNRRFCEYDSVFVEMILPEGVDFRQLSQKGENHEKKITSVLELIALIQDWAVEWLGLTGQIDGIDYRAANIVHADFHRGEFQAAFSKNREWERLFSDFASPPVVSSQEERGWLAATKEWLFAKDRRMILKRWAATELASYTVEMPFFYQTLIKDRNAIPLMRLRESIEAGGRKLAIFYGAAHLPDLASHLESDFGLVQIGVTWLTAWGLN